MAGGSGMARHSEKSEPTPKSSEMSDEKKDQALQDALADIEKRYGRGAIMKLGDAQGLRGRGHLDRLPRARYGARRRRAAARPHHRDLRPGGRRQVDARVPRRGVGAEAAAASRRTSTSSTRSTRTTPSRAASTSPSCSSRSRTPASRRSRSATRSCAATPSTSSSSIASPRSCRAPRSKARWATRCRACRRG